MVGGDGGIVCPRPDAFRVDVSSRPSPLREEIENGERHRGLIDPASLIRLFGRKRDGGGERQCERKKEEIGDLLLSSPYWVISGQGLFTKYCGVLFC